MIKYAIACLGWLVGLGLCIFAQGEPSSVTVLDEETKEPLSGVLVKFLGVGEGKSLKQQKITAGYTDEQGQVSLPAKWNTLEISLIGYEKAEFGVEELERVDYKVYLHAEAFQLDEVIVAGLKFRESARNLPFSISVVEVPV